MTDELCNYEGCQNPQRARGYCETHYRQLRQTGELNRIRAYKPTKERKPKSDYEIRRRELIDNQQIRIAEHRHLIIKAIPTSVASTFYTAVIVKKSDHGINGLKYCFSSAIFHTDAESAIREGRQMIDTFIESLKNDKIQRGEMK
jgi:hypothetical protein